jgi:glycosyltransferase involved in cell wall biosynthesis
MRKLNIYVLASNLIPVPPKPKDLPGGFSGAPEQMVHVITEGLVKRGHKVTLFASGDSKTKAKLFPTVKIATSKVPDVRFGTHLSQHFPYQLHGIAQCYREARKNESKIDVIHSHFMFPSALFSSLVKIPTVSTCHSPLRGLWSASRTIMSTFTENHYYVSISDAQRKHQPDLKYIRTIYHGVDLNRIKWSNNPKDYAVIVGRISPQKGTELAIKVAKQAKLPLYIFGGHEDNDYWNKKIKPHIDNRSVIYKNFVPQEEVFKYVASAKVMLFPIDVEEAFGLAMIEALAAGTPVIAFNRGSVPEIIEDGKNGFIVEDAKGMSAALKNIDQIDRAYCRKSVENKFSLEKMIDGYEDLFYKLASKHGKL